jgi:hypothetical protein
VIVAIFAGGLVAGLAVVIGVHWLGLHALFALVAALLSALALTVLLIREATAADGLPPSRYDSTVIGFGFTAGALVPVVVLVFARWANRQAKAADPPDLGT